MRVKAMEPILLLGRDRFSTVDVRVRVKGGGQSAQIYAIRQSIAKAMVAYAQKCEFPARLIYYYYHSLLRARSARSHFSLGTFGTCLPALSHLPSDSFKV